MTGQDQPRDHAPPGDDDDVDEVRDIEENLKSRATWVRLLFILVFFVLYAVSRIVVFATVMMQFFWVLFTAETNKRLSTLGHSLALYTCEVIDYLTFNTDDKPFPFDRDWPVEDTDR